MIYVSQLLDLSVAERLAAGRNMRPYSMSRDKSQGGNGTLPVAVTTGGTTVNFRAPNYGAGASIFEGTEWVFSDQTDTTALNNCTAFFQDYGGRKLMNAPCHVRTLFGTGRLPGVLHEPLIMPARDILTTIFTKISGGTVNVRPYCNGVVYGTGDGSSPLVKDQMRRLAERFQHFFPRWITFDNGAPSIVANSTNNPFDIRIGENTELFTMTAVATGDFALSIEEVDTGTTLMNGKISQGNAIGDARYPTVFEFPYLIPAGTRLRLLIDDLSGSTNTIYLTFAGRGGFGKLEQWAQHDKATEIATPMWNVDRAHLGAA